MQAVPKQLPLLLAFFGLLATLPHARADASTALAHTARCVLYVISMMHFALRRCSQRNSAMPLACVCEDYADGFTHAVLALHSLTGITRVADFHWREASSYARRSRNGERPDKPVRLHV